jgi:hypothetical protein
MKPGASDFGWLLEQKFLAAAPPRATGTDRGSNRYFPADFDDRTDRQLEIIGQVGGVALHESD